MLVASLLVAAPAHAASQSVSIGDFFYRADRVRIDPGDSVTWTNRGDVLHTVTSRRGAPEGFDSGNVDSGQTFTRAFAKAGTYDYVCTLHPGQMRRRRCRWGRTGSSRWSAGCRPRRARRVRVAFRLSEDSRVTVKLTRRGKTVRTRAQPTGARRRLAGPEPQAARPPAATAWWSRPRTSTGNTGAPLPHHRVDRPLDLVDVADVRRVVVPRRWARPRTRRPGSPPAAPGWWCAATAPARWRRSTCARRPRSRRRRTAPRARRSTLFAAIDAPVPVQQHTTPWSARPSATSRAAASLAQAQSSRSPSASAPCGSGSWPSARRRSTRASATPVRSSADTLTFIGAEGSLGGHARAARGRDRRPPRRRRGGRRARGVGAGAGHGHDEDVRPTAGRAGRARGRRRAPAGQDVRGRAGRPGAADPPDVGGAAAGVGQARVAARPRVAAAGAPGRRPRAAPARVRHPAARVGQAAARRRRGVRRGGGQARPGRVARAGGRDLRRR